MRCLVWLGATLAMLALTPSALASTASRAVTDPVKTDRGHPFDLHHDLRPRSSSPRGLAATRGPGRLVIGVYERSDLREVRRRLEGLALEPEVLRELRAIAVHADRVEDVERALAGDARIAYVDADKPLRPLGDPFDAIDPDTGINFLWAFDAIGAGPGLAAVGGGSQFPVAVVDTGVDVAHPDLAGRILGSFSAIDGGEDVADDLGHGTFVAGLIGAIDGNGIGGKGAAGSTGLLAVKASTPGGEFFEAQLARGIVWAVDAGARVINLSLGGSCPSSGVVLTAIDYAYERNVVLVAASGNNALLGNLPNCPAADLGGTQGGWGTGLSVGATRPDGQRAAFSTFNDQLSVAAPGASGGDCRFGVLSTLPTPAALWDAPSSCSAIFAPPEADPARWGYGEGTSFAAPLVSAVAALALQANPNLTSEQVAEVVKRSAHQTAGTGWNQQTGFGVVDAAAAVALGRGFDTAEPGVSLAVRPMPQGLRVSLEATDVGRAGEEPSGGLAFRLERSRDGASFEELTPLRDAGLRRTYRASRAGPPYWFRAWVCDANRNCAVETIGPKRPRLIKPKVRLRVQRRAAGDTVRVTLREIPGLRGKAKILLQRKERGRFRTLDRLRLAFGKSTRRKLGVADRHGSDGAAVRVRAIVRKAPDWRAATSRAVTAFTGHGAQ
ncbi:MAG: S8 family serine peptidase [Gaiellales bacterium]